MPMELRENFKPKTKMNEPTQNDGGGPFAPYFKRMETIDGVTMLDMVHGCTMRDYFAAQALQGLLANQNTPDVVEEEYPAGLAVWAYEAADAMIQARAAK